MVCPPKTTTRAVLDRGQPAKPVNKLRNISAVENQTSTNRNHQAHLKIIRNAGIIVGYCSYPIFLSDGPGYISTALSICLA